MGDPDRDAGTVDRQLLRDTNGDSHVAMKLRSDSAAQVQTDGVKNI